MAQYGQGGLGKSKKILPHMLPSLPDPERFNFANLQVSFGATILLFWPVMVKMAESFEWGIEGIAAIHNFAIAFIVLGLSNYLLQLVVWLKKIASRLEGLSKIEEYSRYQAAVLQKSVEAKRAKREPSD